MKVDEVAGATPSKTTTLRTTAGFARMSTDPTCVGLSWEFVMLSSLLPGLRELRTPLATGYLWLANIWLMVGWKLPSKKPANGPIAAFWDLGTLTGKAAVLAVISFAAYMIGTFVEVDPLHVCAPRGRPEWITRIRNLLKKSPHLKKLLVSPLSNQARN